MSRRSGRKAPRAAAHHDHDHDRDRDRDRDRDHDRDLRPTPPAAGDVDGHRLPPDHALVANAGEVRFGGALIIAAVLHLSWTAYSATGEVRALLSDRDPTLGRQVPLALRAALAAAKEVARQQATLAVAAAVLAVLLAIALVAVGVRVRRGAPGALRHARQWAFVAMGAVVVWLGLRLSLVPAQARAIELLRAATPPGASFGAELFDDVSRSFTLWPFAAAALQLLGPAAVVFWTMRSTKHEAPPGGRASRSQGS